MALWPSATRCPDAHGDLLPSFPSTGHHRPSPPHPPSVVGIRLVHPSDLAGSSPELHCHHRHFLPLTFMDRLQGTAKSPAALPYSSSCFHCLPSPSSSWGKHATPRHLLQAPPPVPSFLRPSPVNAQETAAQAIWSTLPATRIATSLSQPHRQQGNRQSPDSHCPTLSLAARHSPSLGRRRLLPPPPPSTTASQSRR